MRSINTFISLVFMILCLSINGVQAQDISEPISPETGISAKQFEVEALARQDNLETTSGGQTAPVLSRGLFSFVAGVVSFGAVVASVVTNSPTDSLKYIAVAIGADQLRE